VLALGEQDLDVRNGRVVAESYIPAQLHSWVGKVHVVGRIVGMLLESGRGTVIIRVC
jgi:hypothetical protein